MRTDTHINIVDELNRKQFAEGLIKGLLSSFENGQESLVIGLNGEWGLGKSTLLEYIKLEIRSQTENQPFRNFIIEFNPWSTSNQVDIQKQFLKVLGAKLGNYNAQFEQLIRDANAITNATSEANKANIEPVSKASIGFLTSIVKNFLKEGDINKLKNEVDERLEDDNIKIFVFVDDIDRLPPSEVAQVFQLIKLNTNFKNTFFFIAFDKKVVKRSLKREYGKLGEKYIEKIVQLDYTLPTIANEDLSRIFYEEINKILVKIDNNLANTEFSGLLNSTLSSLWESHLFKYVTNVRHIIRVCNAIEVRLPIIYDDVNLFDFILIEVLRLFDYSAYEWIIKNQRSLIHFQESSLDKMLRSNKTNDDAPKLSDQLEDLMKGQVKSQYSKEVIKAMFLHNHFMSENEITELLQKEKRVASSKYFEHYFSFKILESNIPSSEIENYISGNQSKKDKILNKFKSKKLLRKFLKELLYKIQGSPKIDDFKNYFSEMLDYSDSSNLMVYESTYFGQSGWFIVTSFLMDLAKAFEENKGYELFIEKAMDNYKSYSRFLFLSTIRNRIDKVGLFDHIKDFPIEVIESSKDKIIKEQEKGLLHFGELIKKGQDSLDEGEQINVLRILARLKESEYKSVIEEYIKDDSNAVVLFKYSLTRENRSGVKKLLHYLQEKDYLMPLMSIEKLDERLSKIKVKEFDGKNKEYLELFYNLKNSSFNQRISYSLDGLKFKDNF